MKRILDARSQEVVNTFDDLTLWSAPFGRLLLENIPMKSGATVVDIGFGTGFPLIELSQRFGAKSKIYGIDIWVEAINLVKEKIEILELKNITLLENSASEIDISDNQVDLVTSNLGINNFGDKGKVYQSVRRILKKDGRLCITTNPAGTFEELFELFRKVFEEMNLKKEQELLDEYIQRRSTEEAIVAEIESNGFELVAKKCDATNFRFVDATALINHSLVRIGFREGWERMIREEYQQAFFERLFLKIKSTITKQGEFKITVPVLYLEFKK
ncbi:MAG: class I SAM-dependent methyltransferase [Saprospiraceae bacterium]